MKIAICLLAALLAPTARAGESTCGLTLTSDGITSGCLPALTTDRQFVAVPITDPDGGRGNPNLVVRFIPISSSGKARAVVIVSADEWNDWPENERASRAKERIAALDKQLGSNSLRMKQLIGPDSAEARSNFKLAAAGYDVVGRAGSVAIARGGATLASTRMPAPKSKGACRGANSPYLHSVYLDGNSAALRFEFRGNDSCPETESDWSVLTLGAGGVDANGAAAANDRGMKHYHAHEWADAAAEFRAAIAADPTHAKAHYNLACVASLTHDRTTALAELRWLSESADPAAKEKLQKAASDSDLAWIREDQEGRRLLGAVDAAVQNKSAENAWTEESFGPLKLGMTAPAVSAALGKPPKKSAMEMEEATGQFVATWDYQGVSLILGADTKKGAATLRAITLRAPSKLTARGVAVGSSAAELARAYPKSQWDKDSSNDERIVVGSIYGGIIFTLESHRVTEIFVGAGAE